MLIVQVKKPNEMPALSWGKPVALRCKGCDEVYSPAIESSELMECLSLNGTAPIVISADTMCNPDNVGIFLRKHEGLIGSADALLVFSCGIGAQTVADMLDGRPVLAACDTYPMPGHQGLAPLEFDCALCGECHLNGTGGICPITACAKSLLNGQCGGSKNGMCEVDIDRVCGWDLINKRLADAGPDAGSDGAPRRPVEIRDFGLL